MSSIFKFASLAFVLLSAIPASADTIILKSKTSNKYITAVSNAGGLLGAVGNRNSALKFDLVELGGNKVALRHKSSGKFLRAGVGKKTRTAVASPHARSWETFERFGHHFGGERFVALKSVQNGKFLTVANGGRSNLLSATADVAGFTEMFQIEKVNVGQTSVFGNWTITHIKHNNRLVVLDLESRFKTNISIRNGSISGVAGCNQFNGNFAKRGNAVSIDRLISTKKLCAPNLMKVEIAAMTGLRAAKSIFINGKNELVFSDNAGAPLLKMAVKRKTKKKNAR